MNQHHGHEDRGKDKINMADYSIFFLNIVANSGLLPAQEAMLKGTGVCGLFFLRGIFTCLWKPYACSCALYGYVCLFGKFMFSDRAGWSCMLRRLVQ